MALSNKIKTRSLNYLEATYFNKRLTSQQTILLSELNQLASDNNVVLSQQSQAVIDLVLTQLQNSTNAITIYALVNEQMDKDTYENQCRHRAQGSFDNKPIHERALRDQLQDHDMTLLMPKSHNHIEVLAPLNRFDQSTSLVQQAIASALTNDEVKHVIIPVGPGHWRGIYLTKPSHDNPKYKLELFDPYGAHGAEAIKALSQHLLTSCGIKKDQIQMGVTGIALPH